MSRKPLIIAHRGVSAHAPENTMAAFRLAVDQGADGVEFDVQLARDGVPVVIHDTTLKRTTGRPENVADLTSVQLSEIDAGSWFNRRYPSRAHEDHTLETIPTLEGVLSLFESQIGPIYIELKCDAADFRPLTETVCSIIRDSQLLPRIIVKSFRFDAIVEVRRLLPEARTAALFEPSIATILRSRHRIIAAAREAGAAQLSLHTSLATAKLTRLAAEACMPVTVWTTDDSRWMARCKRRGIGAIITNDPATLIKHREPTA